MKIRFWGVRGSYPVPGPDTNRYGGNTSCVAVKAGDEGPLIIIDAGTGIRKLGKELMQSEFAVADTQILPPKLVARGCAETPYRGAALLFYIAHSGVRDVLAVAHSP